MSEWVRFRQPDDVRDMVGCEVEGCDENARWRREGPHRCHAHVPSKQPEAKMTEVVGHLDQVGLMREIAHGYWHLVEMDDLMPHVELGRRGRFEITVKFTPEEA